ncbi:uncharacterized protein APUU_51645A [Aspergillus puulaauensis]|uniref:Uncharacterized protein n=1 Tax=Aspergillus puulaauensis TaxID=1220207 RepID=A0A7R8APA6_9EURO|nr:uncharacterized protein APUU_51645A [Aspergillus puulaauensis]BCS26934.1 hypothetical protein APUU_51645A [Aspergillus puulaauensis]
MPNSTAFDWPFQLASRFTFGPEHGMDSGELPDPLLLPSSSLETGRCIARDALLARVGQHQQRGRSTKIHTRKLNKTPDLAVGLMEVEGSQAAITSDRRRTGAETARDGQRRTDWRQLIRLGQAQKKLRNLNCCQILQSSSFYLFGEGSRVRAIFISAAGTSLPLPSMMSEQFDDGQDVQISTRGRFLLLWLSLLGCIVPTSAPPISLPTSIDRAVPTPIPYPTGLAQANTPSRLDS